MTSWGMAKSFSMMAVCGPTHDDQPVFQWSKSDFKDLSHMGHPDVFDFDPIKVEWAHDSHK